MMPVAFGLKAHSGWAALVVVGQGPDGLVVVDRRRIELVEEAWAKQPYHAAERLKPAAARDLVARGISAANRMAVRELRAALTRAKEGNHDVAACAVLAGAPMPAWNTDEILAVHFRMHKAEGVLFRDALAAAATTCGMALVAIPEKALPAHGERALGLTSAAIDDMMKRLGKSIGPPWGRDQKDAALAAMVALRERPGKKKSASS